MPRDLFDTILLPGILRREWNQPRFRGAVIAFAGILDHPLFRYGPERFDRVTDDAVRESLWTMMSGMDQPSARYLREAARETVAPLLALDDAEREYTERIQIGEFSPELLFPDDEEIADRLRRHPALLWKVENAKRHASRASTGK